MEIQGFFLLFIVVFKSTASLKPSKLESKKSDVVRIHNKKRSKGMDASTRQRENILPMLSKLPSVMLALVLIKLQLISLLHVNHVNHANFINKVDDKATISSEILSGTLDDKIVFDGMQAFQ